MSPRIGKLIYKSNEYIVLDDSKPIYYLKENDINNKRIYVVDSKRCAPDQTNTFYITKGERSVQVISCRSDK